jgi:hypothetical protein
MRSGGAPETNFGASVPIRPTQKPWPNACSAVRLVTLARLTRASGPRLMDPEVVGAVLASEAVGLQ